MLASLTWQPYAHQYGEILGVSVITEIREQNTITFAGADDDQHDMCSIYA